VTWQFLACRVLSGLAVTAATGVNPKAHPTRLAPHQPARSPSRPHCCDRWWALTPPFHPSPALTARSTPAGLLSVAVLRRRQSNLPAPHLTVSVGGLPSYQKRARSREVPQRAGQPPATDRQLVTRQIKGKKPSLSSTPIITTDPFFVKMGDVGGCPSFFCAAILSNEPRRHEGTKAQRTTRLNVSTWTLACFVFATDFHGNIRKHR